MQIGVVAVILMSAITMFIDNHQTNKAYNLIVTIISFIASYFFGIGVLYLLALAIIYSLIKEFLNARRNERYYDR
jgi:Na+-translocating ferredoxin:NAD+ oxidoreductase RnfD subunit